MITLEPRRWIEAKAVRAPGCFPTDQAALKCVYLAVMSLVLQPEIM